MPPRRKLCILLALLGNSLTSIVVGLVFAKGSRPPRWFPGPGIICIRFQLLGSLPEIIRGGWAMGGQCQGKLIENGKPKRSKEKIPVKFWKRHKKLPVVGDTGPRRFHLRIRQVPRLNPNDSRLFQPGLRWIIRPHSLWQLCRWSPTGTRVCILFWAIAIVLDRCTGPGRVMAFESFPATLTIF